MCIRYFCLVIYDNNNNNKDNNNNFFDLEAFLQVPIHLQINKTSKKKTQIYTKQPRFQVFAGRKQKKPEDCRSLPGGQDNKEKT